MHLVVRCLFPLSYPSAFLYTGMRDSGCSQNATRGGPLSQPGDTLDWGGGRYRVLLFIMLLELHDE
jgi:hypothetical protein